MEFQLDIKILAIKDWTVSGSEIQQSVDFIMALCFLTLRRRNFL